ncbi:copper chaperone PCu(A)C [Pleionea mediterranea]|nr:copper chaperone PCu(A)C [Pleionea mediterranea]
MKIVTFSILLILTMGFTQLSASEAESKQDSNLENKQDSKQDTEILKIENAWVRSVLPVQRSTAMYMTLTNHSSTAVELLEVTLDIAKHSMMHQTVEQEGVSSMKHQSSITLAPKQTVEFNPGGLHVMLMGLNHPVSEQQVVNGVLHFSDGSKQKFTVPVKSAE